MPKFPRFTSGTFGRLDFATMNDLFDRVEQLESALGVGGAKRNFRETETLVVRPTQLMSTASGIQTWRWEEVIVDEFYLVTEIANRSSTGPNGQDDYLLVGKNLVQNQPCFAKALYDETGKLFYRAFEESAGSLNFAFGAVTGATVIAADKKWRYDLVEVEVLANGTFTPKNPQVIFSAVNGCEEMPDPTPPSTGLYGVGFNPPSGLTQCKRMPIRNGIVVPCFQSGAGWGFSIPNGYSIVC